MNRSAIILAGGLSSRFGLDKGLLLLAGKPLINHVLDAIDGLTDEMIVVTSSMTQKGEYRRILDLRVKIVIDKEGLHTPLIGALTGLEQAEGEYSLLLPCDAPFIHREIASLLLDLCIGKSAVVPRWPNGWIEPLQAAYHTDSYLKAANEAVSQKNVSMLSIVSKMRAVRFISVLVLKQLDPELQTFFNVNTPLDLKKAANTLIRKRKDEFRQA